MGETICCPSTIPHNA